MPELLALPFAVLVPAAFTVLLLFSVLCFALRLGIGIVNLALMFPRSPSPAPRPIQPRTVTPPGVAATRKGKRIAALQGRQGADG